MVIELFGLPGAGKTVLANELAALLGIPVIRLGFSKRVFYWLKFAMVSPKKTVLGVKLLFQYGKEGKYSLFMNGYLDRYARFEVARTSRGIVDEGPFQNTLSFPSRLLFEGEIKKFVEALPHPTVLIRVTAEPTLRKERQVMRGRIARTDAWEAFAQKNEEMVIRSLPKDILVLEYPRLSIQEIAKHITAL